MKYSIRSIRPFIGAKDFDLSRKFYQTMGFEESRIGDGMSFFHLGDFGFYLQRSYVKDWIDNTMVFLEVEDANRHLTEITELDLAEIFPGARLSAMVENDWGREFFLHDPSGVLWHIGEFV